MADQAQLKQEGEPLDALVVGAGFNGVFQLYQLRKRGFNVKVIDAGAELGGVWYANCYLGARVDSLSEISFYKAFAGTWPICLATVTWRN